MQKRSPSTFLVRNPYKPLHGMRARPPLRMASGVHFGGTFAAAFGHPFGRPFGDGGGDFWDNPTAQSVMDCLGHSIGCFIERSTGP